MQSTLQLLLLEDQEFDAELTLMALERHGMAVKALRVDSESAFRAALAAQKWDIILSDYSMPGFDAHTALSILQQETNPPPFVIYSGACTSSQAEQARSSGAIDFILKDEPLRLVETLRSLSQATQKP